MYIVYVLLLLYIMFKSVRRKFSFIMLNYWFMEVITFYQENIFQGNYFIYKKILGKKIFDSLFPAFKKDVIVYIY